MMIGRPRMTCSLQVSGSTGDPPVLAWRQLPSLWPDSYSTNSLPIRRVWKYAREASQDVVPRVSAGRLVIGI